jgi:antitoxin (DNA-binding transcriptional repressor) of toxin-antitoxin stability system
MDDVTLPYAKEHLEDLIDRAARGEVVRISDPKSGAFRLVPDAQAPYPKRVIGQWRGKIQVPARLMEPLSDEELRWLSGEDSA